MIRINKLTDYALLILSELSNDSEKPLSAKTISEITHVPYATTNKILKLLTPSITISKGGKYGGFYLSNSPSQISLLMVLKIMEGNNISMTDCSVGNDCSLHNFCKTKDKLNAIDKEINLLLSKKTLLDIK